MAQLQLWASQNPVLAMAGLIVLSAVVFVLARNVIARNLLHVAKRTANKLDDMIVRDLHLYRLAWLAPLILIYIFAYLFPAYQRYIEAISLFLILWVTTVTLISLLNTVNDVYENSKGFSGVSIQGYLDIAKILIVAVAVILSIAIITGESPLVLLTGLGAVTAVLLLVFHDTILSIIASIQIVVNELIKEGDWIEVPSYEADGDVVNISLHAIKVRNADMTYTVIPTYRIIEVPYKNYRGIKESGARRIQRSLLVDMISIKFCDEAMLDKFRKIDLIHNFLGNRIKAIEDYQTAHLEHYDSPLDGPQITNIEVFRAYIVAYLKNRQDIYQEGKPFLVRALSPRSGGLPIEVYAFAKTADWEVFESIQADIFDHLLAAANYFDLRVFQEPTGLDFSNVAHALMAGHTSTVSTPDMLPVTTGDNGSEPEARQFVN
jgi:miniconductance mechanosensitive channel